MKILQDLLQEAPIDDRFAVQMKKVNDAIVKLEDIVAEMTHPTSTTKPVKTQLTQLKSASESLTGLMNKVEKHFQ